MSWKIIILIAFCVLLTVFLLLGFADYSFIADQAKVGTPESINTPIAGQSGVLK